MCTGYNNPVKQTPLQISNTQNKNLLNVPFKLNKTKFFTQDTYEVISNSQAGRSSGRAGSGLGFVDACYYYFPRGQLRVASTKSSQEEEINLMSHFIS